MDDTGRQTPYRWVGIRPDDYPEIDKKTLVGARLTVEQLSV
ncbi:MULTISPECIES: hypothetical protein [Thiocapsa]|nr:MULTISPECIES: hypothetical protein [Thiocapsa]